ncbi:unnamed protein product [Schistosoma margrebowiei]|uniref:Uncharacterized protein n=1 Tax=Schistosoma margrebowiei TaxID=48269 RepID=A0A183N6S5_9TREM|nr:unnamed protein product [Schistosoma margrebowiei]
MEDVRNKEEANIASEHHMVVAKMRLKLNNQWTNRQTGLQSFNAAFLLDTDKLNEFKKKYSTAGSTERRRITGEIKEILTSTCQEMLGRKKHHHKEWISIEILDKIEEMKNKMTTINNSQTRAEKVKAQAEYTEADMRMEKSIRTDKEKYMGNLATKV